MTIRSYFYDSTLEDPREYAATDFANAFGVITSPGILAKDDTGALGFDLGGVGLTTIYAGKAVAIGRFIEVTGTEILTVPAGSYNGSIILRVDADGARTATLVVKTDRTLTKTSSFYELGLYDVVVSNGTIQAGGLVDKRVKGGAVPNTYQTVQVDNFLKKKPTVYIDTDGSFLMQRASMAIYGTYTPNANFLITVQDTAHSHRYIMILAHWQYNDIFECTTIANGTGADTLTYIQNTLGTLSVNGLAGAPRFAIQGLSGSGWTGAY
jgi:cyclophilin family peptidyl-prolyl cis-trans isomerase